MNAWVTGMTHFIYKHSQRSSEAIPLMTEGRRRRQGGERCLCQVLFYPFRVSGEGFRGQRADTVNSLFGEEQSVYVTAAVYKSGIFPLLHLQILERRDHTCFHCLSLDSRYLSIASFSTTGARYLRTNHTPSCLSLLPSFILFSFVFWA